MLFVGDFVRICTKAVSVTDFMFQQENYVLNHIMWIKRLGVVFMNSQTHGCDEIGLTTFGWVEK